jgi:hypothetical protein
MQRLGVPLSMYVYRFGVELGEVLKWRWPPRIASTRRTARCWSAPMASSPDAPVTDMFDPAVRLCATSAASYAEASRFDLTWTPVPGAIRYEVWRALEGVLVSATSTTTDLDLHGLAPTQPGAFELRSGDIFTTHYTDEISGRAPTRAIYRVRAMPRACRASSSPR